MNSGLGVLIMSERSILENLNPECSHYKRCLEHVGRQPSLTIALCENCKLNPKLRHVSGQRATACEQCGLCRFVPRVTSSCFFSKRLANRKQLPEILGANRLGGF